MFAKTFWFAVVVCICLSLIRGCGGSDPAGQASAPVPSSQVGAVASPAPSINVNIRPDQPEDSSGSANAPGSESQDGQTTDGQTGEPSGATQTEPGTPDGQNAVPVDTPDPSQAAPDASDAIESILEALA